LAIYHQAALTGKARVTLPKGLLSAGVIGTVPWVTRQAIDAIPHLVHFCLGGYDLLLAPFGDGKRIAALFSPLPERAGQ
jgi:hypothetical protein